MKKVYFYLALSLLFWNCQNEYKQCDKEQPTLEMAIYNDILTEFVEHHSQNRYLGQAGVTLQDSYATYVIDSLEYLKKSLSLRHEIFGDSLKFKTVFIVDTIMSNSQSNDFNNGFVIHNNLVKKYFGVSNYVESIGQFFKKISSNHKNIIDSLNTLQLNIKAKSFHACTYKVKSIKDFKLTDFNNEIGVVSFSKIYLNEHKDEGIISCNYQCGNLCGKGYVFYIRKIKKQWKILDFRILWLS